MTLFPLQLIPAMYLLLTTRTYDGFLTCLRPFLLLIVYMYSKIKAMQLCVWTHGKKQALYISLYLYVIWSKQVSISGLESYIHFWPTR